MGTDAAGALNVPGAAANVPGAAEAEAAGEGEGENSNYARTESTVSSELNRTVQTTTTAPGTVTGLSVSVLLDESVPEAQATALQEAVAAAAGVDATRGDAVIVTRVPFNTTELEEARAAIEVEAAAAQQQNMIRLAIPILAVLLAGGFFFFFLRRLGKARAAGGGDLTLAVGGGPGVAALGAGETVEQLQARMQAEAELRQREAQASDLTQLVQSQPQAVAEVVRHWDARGQRLGGAERPWRRWRI